MKKKRHRKQRQKEVWLPRPPVEHKRRWPVMLGGLITILIACSMIGWLVVQGRRSDSQVDSSSVVATDTGQQDRARVHAGRMPPEPDAGPTGPLVAEKIRQARQAVLGAPDSAGKWGQLGMVYDVHNFVNEAVTCYTEAERLDASDFRWPYMTALCLTDAAPEEVIGKLRRAQRLRPDYAPVNIRLGQQLLSNGQLEEAERFFLRALETDSTNTHALLGLGQIALANDQAESSRAYLEKAARRNLAHHEVFATLARVYHALELPDLARTAALRGLGPRNTPIQDPVRFEVIQQGATPEKIAEQANALLAAGQFDVAIQKLRTAIEVRPDYARAHMDLGLALIIIGQEPEGIAELREADRIEPGIVDIGIDRAVQWARAQRR